MGQSLRIGNRRHKVVLPDEMLENIFLRVHVVDLLNLINVCQQYRRVARLAKLWDGPTIGRGGYGRREILIRGRGETVHLDDVSTDDLGWVVCRVREASLMGSWGRWRPWSLADLAATNIFTNIIEERKDEELSLIHI